MNPWLGGLNGDDFLPSDEELDLWEEDLDLEEEELDDDEDSDGYL